MCQCDVEVKGGSIFSENFEVGPLCRVILHSDFRVRCWKVIFFLVNLIPITNSSVLWCSHCPMCWHTWDRVGQHTGHENTLWTHSLPRPGMKMGIPFPQWIRIKFLNNTNAYLKLAKFNSNSIGPKSRVELGWNLLDHSSNISFKFTQKHACTPIHALLFPPL